MSSKKNILKLTTNEVKAFLLSCFFNTTLYKRKKNKKEIIYT